jgi:cell division protease FtsH
LLAQWVAIGLLLFAIFNLFQASSSGESQSPLAFSDFLNDVDNGRVSDVKIKGNNISGHLEDGPGFATYAPNDPNLVTRLVAENARITAAPAD